MTREANLETALRKIIALADDASTAAVHDVTARIVSTAEAALVPAPSVPHVITDVMAGNALAPLGSARDMAVLVLFGNPKKKQLIADFSEAAAALGFTLSPAPAKANTGGSHEDDVATPSPRCPDSGRPSLDEPAAPSELSHNFGA